MVALETVRETLADRLTPAMAWGRLQAMAQVLNWVPSMRHHLVDTHPSGTPFVFEADFEFVTRDEQTAVHIRFSGGKMRVGFGRLTAAHVSVWFRSQEHMRTFFNQPSELLNMLLANDVNFEGNLSYLAKFGNMSASVRLMGRKQEPSNGHQASRGPARWQDLPIPPTGEPCGDRPVGEVTHLADPFLAEYNLDDFPRIKQQLWAHRTVAPAMCTERARLVTEFKLTSRGSEGLTPVLRQARAMRYLLGQKRPIVHPDDVLAGTTTSKRIGVLLFPEGIAYGIWPELLTMEARELNPYRVSDEEIAILDRQVLPFWMEDNVREWTRSEFDNAEAQRLEERWVLYFLWKHTSLSHTIADTPAVLEKGLAAIQAEARKRETQAEDERSRQFYRALDEALQGVLDYAAHLAAQARSQAEQEVSPERKAELDLMAQVLDRVPAGPCETLQEAAQVVWLLLLCHHQESTNTGFSCGRLDLWLQPYLEHDLAGVSEPDEKRRLIERSIELTSALMLKMTDHLPMVPDLGNRLFGGSSSNQVITLGGEKMDGTTAVCDMTWIFLKATEMLRLRDPNMNARYAPGVNSEAYLRRLCEVNLLTRATPSLHNDAAMVPAMQQQGFTLEHARDWSATGCVEPTSSGRHFGHTNCMMLNLVAPLEMALNDGHHPLLGERVGPRTGDPRSFTSYEDFLDAYKQHLGLLIDLSVDGNNNYGRAHQVLRPVPILSAMFEGPMEAGRDLTEGGALYNSSGAAMIGLSDVVDSLAAIKRLVFDARTVSFDDLLRALDANFEGHPELEATIRTKVPKFGRNDPLTDGIAKDLMDFAYTRFQARRNYRGGTYFPGYWSMSNHVAFGGLSGALPSGRKRGEAFTPGLTPAPGCGADLTEQIQTVAGLDGLKMPNNIAFNVKVVPGAVDDHQAVLDRMQAYVGAYFDQGGMQMQFNVVSTETLRDAMDHPEQYRDLLVRISGYNAYFVEMNRDMQFELIERMEHSLGIPTCS